MFKTRSTRLSYFQLSQFSVADKAANLIACAYVPGKRAYFTSYRKRFRFGCPAMIYFLNLHMPETLLSSGPSR